ncbi:hypothetical protein NE237_024688 [Protea cynaroides]|uniref:Uncharacterized protein n=1 Tax=Protea cynaroides TaxID=273540 RepID=A0A9Q0H0H7_9MAGN|nr:hypothetical protein NE237_024688 [Protea cynaroides]
MNYTFAIYRGETVESLERMSSAEEPTAESTGGDGKGAELLEALGMGGLGRRSHCFENYLSNATYAWGFPSFLLFLPFLFKMIGKFVKYLSHEIFESWSRREQEAGEREQSFGKLWVWVGWKGFISLSFHLCLPNSTHV